MAGRSKQRTRMMMSKREMGSRDHAHDRLGGPESDAHQAPRTKRKKRKSRSK